MGRREEKKEHTRQQLTATALELFRTRGFDDTRVQDIVDKVGVSPATFFNYFPGKEAVLEAESDVATELFGALLRHELDRGDKPATERLAQITRVLGTFLSKDPEIGRLLATRTSMFFGSTGERAERDRANQAVLAELFHQGQSSGELRPDADPAQLAEIYLAIVLLTTTNWLIEWHGPPADELPGRLVSALEVLLNGISTGRQHAKAAQRKRQA
jgi:AcrR family transcriptional regulator